MKGNKITQPTGAYEIENLRHGTKPIQIRYNFVKKTESFGNETLTSWNYDYVNVKDLNYETLVGAGIDIEIINLIIK